MGLIIDAAVCSSVGRRKNNEDNFYVNGVYMEREQMNNGGLYDTTVTDDVQLYAVCDGMGGAEFGEEASFKGVKALEEYQKTSAQPDSTVYLSEMIDKASRDIDSISLERGMPSGSVGTTIAMLVLRNNVYRTVHVGDSRVYLFRDGKLEQITRDDSEVQNMVDRGEITREQAWNHPRKNVITRHLGMPTDDTQLVPTISERETLKAGDRFMICSDGVSDQLRDHAIQMILERCKNPKEAVETIVRTSLKEADQARIRSDNITCLVANVRQVGDPDMDDRRIRRMKMARNALCALAGLIVCALGYNIYQIFNMLR